MATLDLMTAIGFNGSVAGGLHVHPGGDHLVYATGSTIVVERISQQRQQRFLQGHTDTISCLAVSKSGRFIASGQVTHAGYPADVFVWDFESLTMIHKFTLHQCGVQAVAFSPNDQFLLTLGGADDGSLALWDLETGKALAGSPSADASGGRAHAIAFTNKDDLTFVSAGEYTIRVWSIHPHTHALNPHNCTLRALRRLVNVVKISADDQLAYCGTSSGDVVVVSVPHKVLKATGPTKGKFALGVRAMEVLPDGRLLVGAGDGSLAICKAGSVDIIKQTKVDGGITSLSLCEDGENSDFFIGTEQSIVYRCDLSKLNAQVRAVCHPHGISDIKFPKGASELFATCSNDSIRVWHTATAKQLLQIEVPNKVCNTIAFLPDGSLILSGWDDGAIRGFLPQSGKQKFEILNAHVKGVTAVTATTDNSRIISGGGDGQVRIWQLGPQTQTLVESLKEHKAKITDIRVRSNDLEFVTSSQDGSCIVWDLKRYTRNQVLFASTVVSQIRYRPDEAQLLTCGTDRKVHYWEVYDGSLLRELEVSVAGALNALDISPDGRFFATGGNDKLLKVLTYDEVELAGIGTGHSGNITRIAICPNQKYIVSATDAGSVFCWTFPTASQRRVSSAGPVH